MVGGGGGGGDWKDFVGGGTGDGDGGGECDLVEGDDSEVGGGGERLTNGGLGDLALLGAGGFTTDREGGGGGVDGILPLPPPPPALPPPHWSLLQSTGRAAWEVHSLADRWSTLPGTQFLIPLITVMPVLQAGASPVK